MFGVVSKNRLGQVPDTGFSPRQPQAIKNDFVIDFGEEHRAEMLISPPDNSSLELVDEA